MEKEMGMEMALEMEKEMEIVNAPPPRMWLAQTHLTHRSLFHHTPGWLPWRCVGCAHPWCSMEEGGPPTNPTPTQTKEGTHPPSLVHYRQSPMGVA